MINFKKYIMLSLDGKVTSLISAAIYFLHFPNFL